jgi:iron complex transport system substrate-binding protein
MDGRARRVLAAALLVAACGGGAPPAERPGPAPDAAAAEPVRVIDDAGREVRLAGPARRIVSLVPSVTETIVALGAIDRLVARTRYDLDPALSRLPSLGGGLDPSIEAIVALEPDLVVAWNARDDRVLAPRLRAAGIPVYAAAIEDTSAIFTTVDRVGRLLDAERRADSLAAALRDSLRAVASDVPAGRRPTAIYLMIDDPPRVAGPQTFIAQALSVAGADPAFPELAENWPTVSLEAVVERNPDVVVLPVGEGLAGRAELAGRPGWRDLPAVRAGRIVEVEADLLARPGPALGRAARALRDGLANLEAR